MSHEIDRRSLLRLGAAGLAVPLLANAPSALASTIGISGNSRSAADLAADRIVASVRRPWFPPRTFPVTRFGAKGDGTTKNTAAFAAAIAACHRTGGGHVVVPHRNFRSCSPAGRASS